MSENKKYLVCTICSSTKYKDKIIDVAGKLEHVGVIVLKPDMYSHADGTDLTEEDIRIIDEMHKQKTDMCDFIIVIDDHIGESMSKEIEYGRSLGRIILYWSHISGKIDSMIDEGKVLCKSNLPQYELEQIREIYTTNKRDPNKTPLCTIVHTDTASMKDIVSKIKDALNFSGAMYFELYPRPEDYSDPHTVSITMSRFHESICAKLAQSDYIITVSDGHSEFIENIQSLYWSISKDVYHVFECNDYHTLDGIYCCAKCGMVLTYDLLKRAMSDPRKDSDLFTVPPGYKITTNKTDVKHELEVIAETKDGIRETIDIINVDEINDETEQNLPIDDDHDDCYGE